MKQSGETMTSVSACHIILTPTVPVGSGRPQRRSNPGPPQQPSRAQQTELRGTFFFYVHTSLSLYLIFPFLVSVCVHIFQSVVLLAFPIYSAYPYLFFYLASVFSFSNIIQRIYIISIFPSLISSIFLNVHLAGSAQ